MIHFKEDIQVIYFHFYLQLWVEAASLARQTPTPTRSQQAYLLVSWSLLVPHVGSDNGRVHTKTQAAAKELQVVTSALENTIFCVIQ